MLLVSGRSVGWDENVHWGADWRYIVVNQECRQMPDPSKPPFSGRDDRTELLSVGNMTEASSANFTGLPLQS